MLKNIVERNVEYVDVYEFEYLVSEGAGYSFPCDKNGKIFPLENEAARKNLQYCRDHAKEFYHVGVQHRRERDVTPAHGTCDCGEEVYLLPQYMGACECENCGKWYNLFGQELLPPEQWEEY